MTPTALLSKLRRDTHDNFGMQPFTLVEIVQELECPEAVDIDCSRSFASRVTEIIEGRKQEHASKAEFDELAAQWRLESGPLSSPESMAMLPSYQRILGMGSVAVPWILEELDQRPAYWFWALRFITGEDPSPREHWGRFDLMARDWIDWGRARGLMR